MQNHKKSEKNQQLKIFEKITIETLHQFTSILLSFVIYIYMYTVFELEKN